MKYGCIGEHLGHSFSKEIHKAIADYPYDLFELKKEELDSFFRERDFCGINVTIPYKAAVIPYLDVIADQAANIGAVNTVVSKGGKLYGYNTDYFGLRTLIESVGVSFNRKKIAILGTGGTSATAKAVVNDMGADEILSVSRTKKEGAADYAEFRQKHADIQILINTTPVGMHPNLDGISVDLDDFPRLEAVIDVVYNPLRTRLVLEAQKRGIPAAGGLLMLVAQAVKASELFLDCKYPDGLTKLIFRTIEAEKENVILIGMPTGGKTTVGKLLAARLGREFVDLDAVIEKETGKKIPELFSLGGEDGFRAVEAECLLKTLQTKHGIVLACGGGTVLKEENRRLLRQTGKVVYLDCPIEELKASGDRPLSSNRMDLEKLYAERVPIYRAAADLTVKRFGTPEEYAKLIEKEIWK